MQLDPSSFIKSNVTDTCSVWNILSSRTLLNAAKRTNCLFCCTAFVQYECLDKPRRNITSKEQELQQRLKYEQASGQFKVYHLDIDDLLDVDVLESRKSLGKGELSSIVFARRTRQGFLTDDQGARRLASVSIDPKNVQTTPHLFGWLIYEFSLSDSDKDKVIDEHNQFMRPLEKYFEKMYEKALATRLKQHGRLG